MWKDFFYFSKSERRGLLILVVLILIAIGIGIYYGNYEEAITPLSEKEEQDYAAFVASLHEADQRKAAYHYSKSEKQSFVLAPFDPNTADSSTFIRLGLRPSVVGIILRYRMKGGTFGTPESFQKVYGLRAEQFQSLLPYIIIGETYQKKSDTLQRAVLLNPDSLCSFKYASGTVIELNSADTTELKKIPGIGSATARRMIAYRNRLGGFYSVEQLQEIPHLSKELNQWFRVEKEQIHQLNLNKASIERLNAHPYINFYQAKVIVEYRKKRGILKSLGQLALYEEFTGDDLKRMEPYVCFSSPSF